MPQPTNKNEPQANQCEYEQLSIWWVRFTPKANYNQCLPCPGLNWSRYGIVHSERLGYQLWQQPLKMASLFYEREVGFPTDHEAATRGIYIRSFFWEERMTENVRARMFLWGWTILYVECQALFVFILCNGAQLLCINPGWVKSCYSGRS